MGYDIELVDKNTRETLRLPDTTYLIRGGNYKPYGNDEAWLSVTYNYAPIFRKVLGEKGIRSLYGMTGKESIPILKKAISKLKDDYSKDYWECTEGNAKKALTGLLVYAEFLPDGIWEGD